MATDDDDDDDDDDDYDDVDADAADDDDDDTDATHWWCPEHPLEVVVACKSAGFSSSDFRVEER